MNDRMNDSIGNYYNNNNNKNKNLTIIRVTTIKQYTEQNRNELYKIEVNRIELNSTP